DLSAIFHIPGRADTHTLCKKENSCHKISTLVPLRTLHHLFNEHNMEQLKKEVDDKRGDYVFQRTEWEVVKRNSRLKLPYKPLVRRVLSVTGVKQDELRAKDKQELNVSYV